MSICVPDIHSTVVNAMYDRLRDMTNVTPLSVIREISELAATGKGFHSSTPIDMDVEHNEYQFLVGYDI